MHDRWIADRMRSIEVSGIRKVFDLAAHLKDPVNLSIGQPHFPVPAPIKEVTRRTWREPLQRPSYKTPFFLSEHLMQRQNVLPFVKEICSFFRVIRKALAWPLPKP